MSSKTIAARTELDNHLRERPNDPAALLRLAELQGRDGAADQALETYEKPSTSRSFDLLPERSPT